MGYSVPFHFAVSFSMSGDKGGVMEIEIAGMVNNKTCFDHAYGTGIVVNKKHH